MAVTQVGTIDQNGVAATSATITVTRTGITAGNNVVVGTIGTSFACSTVDDGTTTISTADGAVNQVSLSKFLALWSFPNHAGGTKTFTATWPNAATANRKIIVLELTPSTLEGLVTVANGFDAAGAIATGNVSPTPTVDGECIVAFAMTDNGAITVGTSYTSLDADTVINNSLFEKLEQATAAAIPGRWSLAATGSWGAVVASYKSSSAAAAYVPRDLQHTPQHQSLISQ